MSTWKEYAHFDNERLERVDVVALNLLCADGLPGSEQIDINACCCVIREWTDKVKYHTDKNLRRFRRHPEEFNHSLPYFYALVLVSILQRQRGVSYNPEKISPDVPFDTGDTFVHGITRGRGGTCATLPVLYLAVGRRLGYPLRLVVAKGKNFGHQFVRWDEGRRARFNIETTCPGLSCHPDAYYRTGLYETSKESEENGCLLQSLTPREELAQFLMQRGWLWLDQKDYRNAAESFAYANGLAPQNKYNLFALEDTMEIWEKQIRALAPPVRVPMNFTMTGRMFPDGVRPEIEQAIRDYQIQQSMLNDPELEKEWWAPMRQGRVGRRRLTSIDVTHHENGSNAQLHFAENNYIQVLEEYYHVRPKHWPVFIRGSAGL